MTIEITDCREGFYWVRERYNGKLTVVRINDRNEFLFFGSDCYLETASAKVEYEVLERVEPPRVE